LHGLERGDPTTGVDSCEACLPDRENQRPRGIGAGVRRDDDAASSGSR